jgi:hypothetical protein
MLKDYWRIAKMADIDLTSPAALFPPRLIAAHDRAEQTRQWHEALKKKAERDARRKAFEERYQQLLVLSWEHDGILIRPVRDEKELNREGKKLNHCAGSYARQHAEGQKAMFLIRRADEPEEPWFTLELDERKLTVTQNRGKRNCAATKEIEDFEAAWIQHCRTLAAAGAKKHKKRRVS